MLNIRHLSIIVATVALSACAGSNVDTTAPTFNKTQYTSDLNTCRGGSAASFALNAVGGTLVGAAIGAANGVFYGAITGDGAEGATVGAIVGGGLGFGLGAMKYLDGQGNTIDSCLRGKGYDLSAS